MNIKLSNPQKLLYPEDKISKADLLHYYESVADQMLPFIVNRPLTLLRCPEDYTQCFYQRHFNEATPPALKSIALKSKTKTEHYIYLTNKEGLFSLVQMGVLEVHPWGSQISNIECPDWITFDLDPGPKVSWKKVVEAALDVKGQLEKLELKSFVKTTGGKGLHVVVPINAKYSWDDVKLFSKSFVELLAKLKPTAYVTNMAKSRREGKIFLDYLRNQRTASAVSLYSTRAKPHAPVSTPLAWEELSTRKSDNDYTMTSILKRLQGLKSNPWKTFWTMQQSLPMKSS